MLHEGGTKRADQLVLEVCDAHVETERFHVRTHEVGTEACRLESTPEGTLLPEVTQARQSEAIALRTEQPKEPPRVRRTPNRHNRHALSGEISTKALSYRLERELVADPFNEDDCACVDTGGQRAWWPDEPWHTRRAGDHVDAWQLEWLLLVHVPSLAARRLGQLVDFGDQQPRV